MSSLLKAYTSLLHRYPFTSQAVQTGILVAAGDVISQKLVEQRKELNVKRTIQFFALGAFYAGPVLTVWYRVLDRVVGTSGKYYGLKKMAIDQICFAPFFLGGFIFGINVLQGKTFEENKHAFKEKYPGILLANYKLWPAAQAINFSFVPLHFQVLYVQCVALFWNTYLCYKTRPDEKTE